MALSAWQRFATMHLSARYEWVRTQDHLLDTVSYGDTLRLSSSFYPKPGYWGTVYYAQGGLTTGDRTHTFGASASMYLGEVTRLSMTLQYETGLKNKTTLEAGVAHRLGENLEFKAQLKTTYSAGSWNTTGMLAGTYYFGVPAAKRLGLGIIRGRIYESGLGLQGAIVRVGNKAAITDKDGSFTFAGLQPGEYYLQIDGSSLKEGFVSGTFLGVSNKVEADQVAVLEIPLVAKAVITGVIESEGVPRFSGTVAGFTIHARQGGDILTTVSDSRGAFSFTELYPGV